MKFRSLDPDSEADREFIAKYEPYVAKPLNDESEEAFAAFDSFSYWCLFVGELSFEEMFHENYPDKKEAHRLVQWKEWSEKYHWMERASVARHKMAMNPPRCGAEPV